MHFKLRKLREERKISQSTIAKLLDISQPQYQRKEVGDVPFSLDEWEKIADLLDVNYEEIVESRDITQNNFNQKGGVAQTIIYYIGGVVEEYKEINQLLKEELINIRDENKNLKEIIKELQKNK